MPVIEIIYLSSLLLLGFFFVKEKYRLIFNAMELAAVSAGAVILAILSFFITEEKVGGTILQTYHGWPHFFYNHQISDVIDRTLIDKWHFLSGGFFIYPLSDVFFYVSLLLFIFSLFKLGKRKMK